MSLMRVIVGAGLFALGYYLGRQSGRLEALRGEFGPYDDMEPVTAADQTDRDKKETGN